MNSNTGQMKISTTYANKEKRAVGIVISNREYITTDVSLLFFKIRIQIFRVCLFLMAPELCEHNLIIRGAEEER
jgi:hypothetical protein